MSASKFVASQVASLMKNEQQSQSLLLKVDPRSTFRNTFLQPATNVFVARQVDRTRWKTRNIDQNLRISPHLTDLNTSVALKTFDTAVVFDYPVHVIFGVLTSFKTSSTKLSAPTPLCNTATLNHLVLEISGQGLKPKGFSVLLIRKTNRKTNTSALFFVSRVTVQKVFGLNWIDRLLKCLSSTLHLRTLYKSHSYARFSLGLGIDQHYSLTLASHMDTILSKWRTVRTRARGQHIPDISFTNVTC